MYMPFALPLALALVIPRAAAFYWEQYYYGDCTGTVENYGNASECIRQQGASVYFSGLDETCTVSVYTALECGGGTKTNPGEGCYSFNGATDGAFVIFCDE